MKRAEVLKVKIRAWECRRKRTHAQTWSLISFTPTFKKSFRASSRFCVTAFFYLITQNNDPFISTYLFCHSCSLFFFLPLVIAGCVLCRSLSHCHQEPRSVPEEWLEIQRNRTIIHQHFDIYLYTLQSSGPWESNSGHVAAWLRAGIALKCYKIYMWAVCSTVVPMGQTGNYKLFPPL